MNFASHCSAANIYQQTIKKKKKYSRTGETSFRIFNKLNTSAYSVNTGTL